MVVGAWGAAELGGRQGRGEGKFVLIGHTVRGSAVVTRGRLYGSGIRELHSDLHKVCSGPQTQHNVPGSVYTVMQISHVLEGLAWGPCSLGFVREQ